jgi:hypothetical protein
MVLTYIVSAGLTYTFRVPAGLCEEVIREMSAMPDQRRKREPRPHLQTRPATMITAIGLCVLIMLIQLVPEIQDAASRLQTTSISNAR